MALSRWQRTASQASLIATHRDEAAFRRRDGATATATATAVMFADDRPRDNDDDGGSTLATASSSASSVWAGEAGELDRAACSNTTRFFRAIDAHLFRDDEIGMIDGEWLQNTAGDGPFSAARRGFGDEAGDRQSGSMGSGGGGLGPATRAECAEWREVFPHLRVCGVPVVSRESVVPPSREVPLVSVTVASPRTTRHAPPRLVSSMGDEGPLVVFGRCVRLLPADQAPAGESEVFAAHGVYEETLALDATYNGIAAAISVGVAGPLECLVLGALWDDVWTLLVPILRRDAPAPAVIAPTAVAVRGPSARHISAVRHTATQPSLVGGTDGPGLGLPKRTGARPASVRSAGVRPAAGVALAGQSSAHLFGGPVAVAVAHSSLGLRPVPLGIPGVFASSGSASVAMTLGPIATPSVRAPSKPMSVRGFGLVERERDRRPSATLATDAAARARRGLAGAQFTTLDVDDPQQREYARYQRHYSAAPARRLGNNVPLGAGVPAGGMAGLTARRPHTRPAPVPATIMSSATAASSVQVVPARPHGRAGKTPVN